MDGRGVGITTFWRDPADGALEPAGVLPLPAPTYLVWHARLPILYAVGELADGTVTALRAGPDGRLHVLGSRPSGGGLPCHLALTPDQRHLLCANYGDGSLAIFGLDDAGRLTERLDLVTHDGRGSDPDRQDGPHVHMAVPGADGTTVSAVDLGIDEIRSYRLSSAGRLTPTARSPLPPGFGPRQLVHRPGTGRAYVVGELGSALMMMDETGQGAFAPAGPLVPATTAEGPNLPSHLELSADGRFLYAAVRGANRISVFATEPDGLRRVGEYPSGAWPRQFALSDDRLYVAAQHDDVVAVFAVDPATGALSPAARHPVATPTCVAIAPQSALHA
jgi:6-phosphogluconolactonase